MWASRSDDSSPPSTLDLHSLEGNPQAWVAAAWPAIYVGAPAPYQVQHWDWVRELHPQTGQHPFVAVWPRGFAKSTCCEHAVVYCGATGVRQYVLYLSGAQERADDHVQAIANAMVSEHVAAQYPDLAERAVNKYGSSLGWRRNRVWTAAGLIVDALGLDTVVRGVKLDNLRPDLIILDDIDQLDDGATTTDRKLLALTRSILPARAPHCAVLVAQNLIHTNGIVTQLVDGRAKFLTQRTVSGPHRAIDGLELEYVDGRAMIAKGTPTWPGVMTLEVLQTTLDEIGEAAFQAELQHEVELQGATRYSKAVLDVHQTRVREPLPQSALPDWAKGIPGLRVYQLPSPTLGYVAYTDPAEGKGRDYTASGIMAARNHSLAMVLEDNDREPTHHAGVLIPLLERYGTPLWGIERAKGEAINLVAGAQGYHRLYYHEDTPQTNLQRIAGRPHTTRPGYPMTEHTKRGLLDRLGYLLDEYAVDIYDDRMLSQLRTMMVDEHGHVAAAPGCHDDLSILLAGLCAMAEQPGVQAARPTVEAAAAAEEVFRPRMSQVYAGNNRRM